MKKEDTHKAYDALMKFYPFTLDDLDGEEWRDINGYEGLYQVSNFGRVKSFHRGTTKIIKPQINRKGYLNITMNKNGMQKTFRIHRLVAEMFILNTDCKPQVNHRDGHKLNNHVNNLEWVTEVENVHHAFLSGLVSQGSTRNTAKLTHEQVQDILQNCVIGDLSFGLSAFARKFNVDRTTIAAVIHGERYKNVNGDRQDKDYTHNRSLPDEIVSWILDVYKPRDKEFGLTALTKKLNCPASTISRIVNRKTYKHVTIKK